MSQFTGPLAIVEVDVDKETWMLFQPLVWEVGEKGSGIFITVPEGFISDGASVPWPLNIVLNRWGRYRRAACLHDHLCALIRTGHPSPHARTRKEADKIFSQANSASGVSLPLRGILYAGVRVGAWTGIGTPRDR